MWNDRSLSPACSRNLPAEAASAAESLSPAEHRASRRPRHHRRGLEPELPPFSTQTAKFHPLAFLARPRNRLHLSFGRVSLQPFFRVLVRLLLFPSLVLDPAVAPEKQ